MLQVIGSPHFKLRAFAHAMADVNSAASKLATSQSREAIERMGMVIDRLRRETNQLAKPAGDTSATPKTNLDS